MEKRRYIKQEWRKNWKYLQEKLPITTGWITDGVSDDITNKEVTEEIMELLDKAREEGARDVFTKDEWFMLKLAMNDIFNGGNRAYEDISNKIKSQLSKLSKKK